MIYYKDGGKLKRRSIAIISDNLAHDTAAVHEYQKIIINYLKNNFEPKKMYYFTDGAGQHFKNKSSFANLQAYNVLENITYSLFKLYSSWERVIAKEPKFSSAAKKVTL